MKTIKKPLAAVAALIASIVAAFGQYTVLVDDSSNIIFPTNLASIPAAGLTGTVPTNALSGILPALSIGDGSGLTNVTSSTAGTKTVFRFNALDNNPTTNTTYATFNIRGDGQAVLDFDTAVQESATFPGVMPEGTTATNFLVRLLVCAKNPTDTNAVARFGVQWANLRTGINSDTWLANAENNVTLTTNTLAYWFTVTNLSVAVGAGEPFRLNIYRDIGDAVDTVTNDVQFILGEVRSL